MLLNLVILTKAKFSFLWWWLTRPFSSFPFSIYHSDLVSFRLMVRLSPILQVCSGYFQYVTLVTILLWYGFWHLLPIFESSIHIQPCLHSLLLLASSMQCFLKEYCQGIQYLTFSFSIASSSCRNFHFSSSLIFQQMIWCIRSEHDFPTFLAFVFLWQVYLHCNFQSTQPLFAKQCYLVVSSNFHLQIQFNELFIQLFLVLGWVAIIHLSSNLNFSRLIQII